MNPESILPGNSLPVQAYKPDEQSGSADTSQASVKRSSPGTSPAIFEGLAAKPATDPGSSGPSLSSTPLKRPAPRDDTADIPNKKKLAATTPIFTAAKQETSQPCSDTTGKAQATTLPSAATTTQLHPSPFNFKRGDLIYGLSADRAKLYAHLCPAQHRQGGGDKKIADSHNLTFINHAMARVVDCVVTDALGNFDELDSDSDSDASDKGAAPPEKTSGLTSRQMQQSLLTDATIREAFSQAYKDMHNEDDLTDYLCETAAAHAGDAQKNLIRLVFEMSALSNRQDGRYDIPQLQFQLATRGLRHRKLTGQQLPAEPAKGSFSARVSKMGILAAALPGRTHHIHFALDHVNMEAVVRKSGEFGNSHTACELRAAHRLGNAVSDRIHFYRQGQPCPPPWSSEPELWSERKPKHLMRFSRLLPPTVMKAATQAPASGLNP